MEKAEQAGKTIDINLQNLLSTVSDEDNPILVMVRLKNKII
jgi:hypothetical protein